MALFSPRSWRRIPIHALADLQDLGFYPLRYAGSMEARPAQVESKDEDPQTTEAEPQELTIPSPQEEAILQEWRALQEVSLPYVSLDSSDGQVTPLSPEKMEELKAHILSGHLTKNHLCRGCLISEGPRRIHRSVRDVDKATHVLHIDIAGSIPRPEDGLNYFLVGALRLPDCPLLIDVRLKLELQLKSVMSSEE